MSISVKFDDIPDGNFGKFEGIPDGNFGKFEDIPDCSFGNLKIFRYVWLSPGFHENIYIFRLIKLILQWYKFVVDKLTPIMKRCLQLHRLNLPHLHRVIFIVFVNYIVLVNFIASSSSSSSSSPDTCHSGHRYPPPLMLYDRLCHFYYIIT